MISHCVLRANYFEQPVYHCLSGNLNKFNRIATLQDLGYENTYPFQVVDVTRFHRCYHLAVTLLEALPVPHGVVVFSI